MKKYKLKLACCLMLICCMMTTMNSCSDTLDSAPDGKISLDDVFVDGEKIAAYLNSCYGYVSGYGVRWYFWMRGPVAWSDEAWDTDAEAEPSLSSGRWYNGNASPSSHPVNNIASLEDGNGNYWTQYWPGIRKCALFLTRLEKVEGSIITEAERSRWKAEAHLLRAYYYAELLRWFGTGLPIERENYSLDYDFSTIERSSYYEVAKFVIEDCDAALSSTELPNTIETNAESYRLTKGFAHALKSRTALYMASPLYNEGNNYWEEAYTINKAALQALRGIGHELYNKINFPSIWDGKNTHLPNEKAKIFNEFFCNSASFTDIKIRVDKETIYQTRNGQGNLYHVDGIGGQEGYKSGTCPSQELVDCFETTDGEPILDLAKPYVDEITHLQPNLNKSNTLYKEQDPYANRDPRFYATVYYNGSKRYTNWTKAEAPESVENYPAAAGIRTRAVITVPGDPVSGIHSTDRHATRTGYFERKFLHPTSGSGSVHAGSAQFKFFRLGEIILNFAEAAAEAGHLAEAEAAVNEIRSRAGMPNLPKGLSKENLILRIHNERRVELALEGHRYFDVRRWTSPGGDLEKSDRWITAMVPTRGASKGKDDNGLNVYEYSYERKPVSKERLCYSEKWLRFPVPLNEVNIMDALTGDNWQNPGW